MLWQRAEGDRAHVGVRAVLLVINQIQQNERVAILTADLEDPVHRIAPATQHLLVSRAQIRPAGQELVQHGLAVRQTVQEHEPVDGIDRLIFGQHLIGTGALQHKPLQMPFHPRAEREADQGPLQLGAALDEAGERPLVAILVHDPWCHLTPPHGQARDSSAYDNVSRVSHAARVATPESRHAYWDPTALRSASGPGQLESGCELAAPPFPPTGEELALLRRRSDMNVMRRLPGLPRNRTLFSRQRRRAADESRAYPAALRHRVG